MLTLALALALAVEPISSLSGPIFSDPSRMGAALLSFAPASGAGMGAECACAAVTGAKGEALTFTRASTLACTIGPTMSGIHNGDVVDCGANLPRAMRAGDGTGSIGLSVFPAAAEMLLRTSEMENAAWVYAGGGGSAAPAVWVNDAGAPDGTETADAVHFFAASGVAYSVGYQSHAATVPLTASLYIMGARPPDGGVPQSGTIDLNIDGLANQCTTCSFNATTWTRCARENVTVGGTKYIEFGHYGNTCGNNRTQPSDVLIWRVNSTNTARVFPSVEATSATVNSAASVGYLAVSTARALASAEASVASGTAYLANMHLWSIWQDANNYSYAKTSGVTPATVTCGYVVGGSSYTGATTGNLAASATSRVSCSYDGTNVRACLDGTCNETARAFTLFATPTRIYVGADIAGANQTTGTIAGLRADVAPGRFR